MAVKILCLRSAAVTIVENGICRIYCSRRREARKSSWRSSKVPWRSALQEYKSQT